MPRGRGAIATDESGIVTPMGGLRSRPAGRPGEYRYGVVFLTTLALCTVVLVLPGADWALATAGCVGLGPNPSRAR